MPVFKPGLTILYTNSTNSAIAIIPKAIACVKRQTFQNRQERNKIKNVAFTNIFGQMSESKSMSNN